MFTNISSEILSSERSLTKMDANLKFKAENVLFRCTYTPVIFARASIQIDWFFSYLLPLVHKRDFNFKFLLVDSEVRSWHVYDAGRPESNAAGGGRVET